MSAIIPTTKTEEGDIMPTVNVYRLGITEIVERTRSFIGWRSATAKVMLVSASYVPNQNHSSKADVAAFEIQGGDYVAGGQLIGTREISTSNNQLRLAGSDVLWVNLTAKPRYGIIYDDTNAVASSKTLFAYLDLGNVNRPRMRIKWSNQGVLVLTVEDLPGFP